MTIAMEAISKTDQDEGQIQSSDDGDKYSTGGSRIQMLPMEPMKSYHQPADMNNYGVMENSNVQGPSESAYQYHMNSGYNDNYSSSLSQSRYMHGGSMGPMTPNITQQSVATPTLNQLLTQNQHQQKYTGSGYGDYASPNMAMGGPSNMLPVYDNWNNQPRGSQPMYPPAGAPRPGVHPAGMRPGAPNQMQLPTGGMYDRGNQQMPPAPQGVPSNYRHPNPQYGSVPPSGNPSNMYRRMAPPQGYPGNMDSGAIPSSPNEMNDMISGQSNSLPRGRSPMIGTSGMMGPPRTPGPHSMDPSGNQMMPPPNQSQAYPPMPYGAARNPQQVPPAQMPGYNYTASSNRMANPYPSGQPIGGQASAPSSQMNGPQIKPVPQSPSQPIGQPSPGQQQLGLVPPTVTIPGLQQTSCPSPSQRTLPTSPSPHGMLSPSHAAESQSSPRVDISAAGGSSVSSQQNSPSASQSNTSNLPKPLAGKGPPQSYQNPALEQEHISQQHQQPGILPEQPGMLPNAMTSYGNYFHGQYPTPPRPGQPYPSAVGGSSQFSQSNSNYPPSNQLPWAQQSADQVNNSLANFSKSDSKNAASSPISAVQSPPMVSSPSGMDSVRRPPSSKSSIAPSPIADSNSRDSTPKPGQVPAGTLSGSSLDVVNKQVEFGPEPMRRPFMEQLCMFYHEKNQPLTSVPTIGKNSLDLWKFYTNVKERGGFQQVCKKKQWKQIGAALSTTSSQNAAFSLKKAYVKYLLPYECKFDRGGIDPQALLNSLETKKDKQSRSAPSPAGSSNSSQDSHIRMMSAGYSDYGNHHPGIQPPGPHMQAPVRPPMYHGDPNMHPQHQYMGYNNMSGHPPPSGIPNGHQPPGMIPQQQSGMMPGDESIPLDTNSDPYRQQQQMSGTYNQQQHMSGGPYPPRMPYYGPRGPPGQMRPPYHQQNSTVPLPQHGNPPSQMRIPGPGIAPGQISSQPPSQQSYPPVYRDANSYPPNQPGHSGAVPLAPQSPAYQMESNQLRPQQMSQPPNYPQASDSRLPAPSTPGSAVRYPVRPGYQTPSRGALSAMLSTTQSDIRTPNGQQWRPRAPLPPPAYNGSPTISEPNSKRSLNPFLPSRSNSQSKKEMCFPPESIEAVELRKVQRRVLYSKELGRANGVIGSYGKLDSWRLIMCLRSGLLTECIWALDVITVLLHDDSTVLQFSLEKIPGLLDILISHYRRTLGLMFEELSDLCNLDSASLMGTGSTTSSQDADEQDIESKLNMLNTTNYSWTARSGMKVVVDSDLKQGKMIPSPSMYSRKCVQPEDFDPLVISFYELEGTKDFYQSNFRRKFKHDVKLKSRNASHDSEELLKDEVHSPAPTSHTSGGTDFSTQTEKRLAPDNGVGQFPVCTFDTRIEQFENSYDSDSMASIKKEAVDDKIKIKQETSVSECNSAKDLEVLEAKLSLSRKRRFSDSIDDEPVVRDGPPLEADVELRSEEIATRCVTLANIFRGLSFVPNNEKILAKNIDLMDIFSRLLSLRLKVDAKKEERLWWWDTLETLREHTLVTLSNVSGYVKLIHVNNQVAYPLMDSLLFWITTPAAYARDPISISQHLSLQSLVLEIICKLCAHPENISMLLATPPWQRINSLFQILTKLLSDQDQVHREFAIVIISCLAQAEPLAARGLALQPSCISQLISVLEYAEQAALSIAQQRGVTALRENPEAMGTSLDMIRRTSATLLEMALIEEIQPLLLRQQDRILQLVMSQILDQHVAKMLCDVLSECTKNCSRDIAVSYVTIDDAKSGNSKKTFPTENTEITEKETDIHSKALIVNEEDCEIQDLNKENIIVPLTKSSVEIECV